MTQVYTFDDSFALLEEETLLEALERRGYQVEYQCRSGYCGSCRTKILDGNVKYLTEPLAFTNDNEILPCCCRPVEDTVVMLDLDSSDRRPQKQKSEDKVTF